MTIIVPSAEDDLIMGLFRRTSEWLLWKSRYRTSLLVGRIGDHMYISSLPWEVGRAAQRIIAYYEVHGLRLRLSPHTAAYHALVEFGDEFRKLGVTEEQEDVVAHAIYCYDQAGTPSRWLAAAERATDRIGKRSQERAVANHALRQVTRDRSSDFNALLTFKPPLEAQLVWKGLSSEFELPQRVTERIRVDVGLVAYWAKLFENFKIVAIVATYYGGGASIRRSPLATTENPRLVAALEGTAEPVGRATA